MPKEDKGDTLHLSAFAMIFDSMLGIWWYSGTTDCFLNIYSYQTQAHFDKILPKSFISSDISNVENFWLWDSDGTYS